MQKREISSLDQLETSGRESGRTTAKDGQKGYSSKSGKESSQPRRRQGNDRVNAGKKQRGGQHRPVFKLVDFLTDETINKLRGIENGRKTKSNN